MKIGRLRRVQSGRAARPKGGSGGVMGGTTNPRTEKLSTMARDRSWRGLLDKGTSKGTSKGCVGRDACHDEARLGYKLDCGLMNGFQLGEFGQAAREFQEITSGE